jgi:hypothetical protein
MTAIDFAEQSTPELAASAGPAAPPAPSLRRAIKGIVHLLAWEIVPPFAAYYAMRALGFNSYIALLAGAGAAALRAAWVLVQKRKLDGFATFLTVLFFVGFATALLIRDESVLLARESIHGAIAGLIFLGSAAIRRPLTYAAYRRIAGAVSGTTEQLNQCWTSSPRFRRAFYTTTLVWGIGMLAESTVRLPLIALLPTDVMVSVSTAMNIGVYAGLIVWTRWYRRRATLHHQPQP